MRRPFARHAQPEDLCLINRFITYEAVFGTLYAIDDPGVDDNDVFGLHEILATSPSATW